jgi:hypothetical protein
LSPQGAGIQNSLTGNKIQVYLTPLHTAIAFFQQDQEIISNLKNPKYKKSSNQNSGFEIFPNF